MLVIHGDKDYRVPIGEGAAAVVRPAAQRKVGAVRKFLYFPDENHWVLTPGNATVWYETVLAFLAQHVLGQEWKRPELGCPYRRVRRGLATLRGRARASSLAACSSRVAASSWVSLSAMTPGSPPRLWNRCPTPVAIMTGE